MPATRRSTSRRSRRSTPASNWRSSCSTRASPRATPILRFLNPDGNNYHYATFDWVSDDGRSGNNVTSLQTAINGAAQFNNRLVTITIDLPTTYGDAGLDPPGDITTEDGWWRIEYNINAANDTTTWQVSIRGNPVHLVLP